MFCEEQSPRCPLSGQPRVSHFFPPLFQSALKFLEEGRQNSEITGEHWRCKENRAIALSPEPARPGSVLAEPGQKGPPSRHLPGPFPRALTSHKPRVLPKQLPFSDSLCQFSHILPAPSVGTIFLPLLIYSKINVHFHI